jgi:biopolymer transport protein TolR
MAMDVGGSKGGIMSAINVTPLVDVMLVLLIIMMIVAPMLQQGVQLTLPQALNTTAKPDTSDQTVVFVDAHSQLFVNTLPVASQDDAVDRIKTAVEGKAEKTVYLKGDVDAPYSAIMKMMDALRKAGIETVGLITDPKSGETADSTTGGGGGH